MLSKLEEIVEVNEHLVEELDKSKEQVSVLSKSNNQTFQK